jgi:predicted transglutaminase-like cysteine proteinase
MQYTFNRLSSLLAVSSLFLFSTMEAGLSSDAKQRIAGRTSQPIGHYEYCMSHLADCSIKTIKTNPVKLSRKKWSEMIQANAFANTTIEPATDMEQYGVEEFWSMPTTYGDCEDYVLMKRKFLMDRGWPASSLLATVVLQPNGDGHAVLTVRTDKGDYILDNLVDQILTWDQTEYKYLKRQAASHSGHWEDIIDSRMSVASIKRQKS